MGRIAQPNEMRALKGRVSKTKAGDEILRDSGKRVIEPFVSGIGSPKMNKKVINTKERVEIWNSIVKSMPDGVLKESDSHAVEKLTVNIDMSRNVLRELDNSDIMVESGESLKVNPLFRTWCDLDNRVEAGLKALGMTPTARNSLKMPDKKEVKKQDTDLWCM